MEFRLTLRGINLPSAWNSVSRQANPTIYTPEEKVALNGKKWTATDSAPDLIPQNLILPTVNFCAICDNSLDCGHLTKKEFRCYWCRREFSDRRPVNLPLTLEKSRQNGNFQATVYGNFCSDSCALAMAIRSQESEEWKQFLRHAEMNLKTISSGELTPAPHWELLDVNGGPLSEADFDRGTSSTSKISYEAIAIGSIRLENGLAGR